jgi:hypothetical protein
MKKVTQYEDATQYDKTKFNTVFDSIWLHDIPASDALVFYYTSVVQAKRARKSGLPALKRFNGIPFTLRRPHLTTKNDFDVFGSPKHFKKQSYPQQELLALSLPRRFLDPLPGFEEDEGLCLLSAEVLKALRPSSFSGVVDSHPWLNLLSLLPPHCILRSFLVMEVDSGDDPVDEFDIVEDPPLRSISVPDDPILIHSTASYLSHIKTIREIASNLELIIMYHYTSTITAKLIIENGLRMSTHRQNEGGVFFTNLGPCAYGMHTSQYELNIIKDFHGIEKLQELKGKGNFDAVIVYGCNAAEILERVSVSLSLSPSIHYFSLSLSLS